VLAIMGAQPNPFVISGAIGLSLQLGRLIDGDLEICMHAEDMPAALEGVTAAGLRIDRDEGNRKARIVFGKHRVLLRSALPRPLVGIYDEAWFARSRRTRFLGIRVRVAPAEEILWLRMVLPSAASLADPLVAQMLLARGPDLDWMRLMARMVGQEALLLAHIFLFWHQYPESARHVVPNWLIDRLRDRADRLEDGDAAGETEGEAEIASIDLSLHGSP
jgi:hypothetical protein